MRMARKIMIQGTGSGKGKSLLVAILCRIMSNEGYKVAPLKTINFTAVTYKKDEKEFGYSQALQAISAKIEPEPLFNPITPKPWPDGTITIFINGVKVINKIPFSGNDLLVPRNNSISSMFTEDRLKPIVENVLREMDKKYDIIIIEGSGPIKAHGLGVMSRALEFANMGVAKITNAPVLMIASTPDSAKGMLSMLSNEDYERIKGLIVNPFESFKIAEEIGAKITPELAFRYGKSLFENIKREIVAVIPYIKELSGLPELDPVQPAPTIPLDLWDYLIERIAKKVENYINMDKIYTLLGI